jgi:hypothetical protein
MTTEHKVIGGISLLTVAILVGGILFVSRGSSSNASSSNPTSSSVPKDQIVAENGMHWHPKLTIFIDGKKQAFPEGLGLSGGVHNPIHTHDDANQDIIHMEFEGLVTKDDTKLGNFFKVWGKKFSSTQIFDKTNGEEGVVTMTVNGKENRDFENYQMHDADQIEIKYEKE